MSVSGERGEPREPVAREDTLLPEQLRALARQGQHVERKLAGDPAVVVAGERESAAVTNEVDDLVGGGRAEPDAVAKAPNLIDPREVDRSKNAAERVEIAVDVSDHGDAHHDLVFRMSRN